MKYVFCILKFVQSELKIYLFSAKKKEHLLDLKYKLIMYVCFVPVNVILLDYYVGINWGKYYTSLFREVLCKFITQTIMYIIFCKRRKEVIKYRIKYLKVMLL